MLQLDQWRAISARIRGLVDAASLDATYIAAKASDNGSWRYLREQCLSIITSLEEFESRFSVLLPAGASAAIARMLSIKSALSDSTTMTEAMVQHMHQAVVQLRAFEAEMTFLLADTQQRVRSITERAFQHLRRTIAADVDVRAKWNSAFDAGEVSCERLGAVHLLSHGIFAFKVDASGARTDLVFPDPVSNETGLFADALVLTEWKIAANQAAADKQFAEAQRQAEIYADGPLATVELRNYRYLVVVTRTSVTTPGDVTVGGVTYRHINLPVQPDVPSRDAKALVKAAGQTSKYI